jgi:hypothetical protein
MTNLIQLVTSFLPFLQEEGLLLSVKTLTESPSEVSVLFES